MRAACEQAGRDPGSIVMSKALVLCVGRDEAEFRRRLDAIGHDEEVLDLADLDHLALVAEQVAPAVR